MIYPIRGWYTPSKTMKKAWNKSMRSHFQKKITRGISIAEENGNRGTNSRMAQGLEFDKRHRTKMVGGKGIGSLEMECGR